MKSISKDELIKKLMQENSQLKSKLTRVTSNIDYISMMVDVELETEGADEQV